MIRTRFLYYAVNVCSECRIRISNKLDLMLFSARIVAVSLDQHKTV